VNLARLLPLLLLLLLAAVTPGVAEPAAPPQAAEKKAAVREGDKIWSGLVYATNETSPKDPPAELRDFAARLKRVFGYNQFQLAGSAVKPIDGDGEGWLVPSKNFSLSVKARRAVSKEARGGYLLSLALYQGNRQIVETETKLAPGSPLFIRGPACGKGHLLIVLQVQP